LEEMSESTFSLNTAFGRLIEAEIS
jgi:hypothetical protein